MSEHVALWRLLEHDNLPFECCDCPFATALDEDGQPNPYDSGEGYYHCALLDLSRVWGENPQCTVSDWRQQARADLDAMMANAMLTP